MKPFRSFIEDAAIWAFIVVLAGVLKGSGAIEDTGVGLASGALWIAIRAYSKAANPRS